MQTDTSTQVRAIRMAIRALETEERRAIQNERLEDTALMEVLTDIKNEIAALNDAITALKTADAFKASLRTFIS